MGTRTVRLDDQAERDLEEIRRTTGMSVSAGLKQGLKVLQEEVARCEVSLTPYDVYAELDLGERRVRRRTCQPHSRSGEGGDSA